MKCAHETPHPTDLRIDNFSDDEVKSLWSSGLQALASRRVAPILLGGGVGSRLQFPHPKAMFKPGLLSQKTLLQLQIERVMRLWEIATGGPGHTSEIPFIVMINPQARDDWLQFFKETNCCGYPHTSIYSFFQGMYPAVDLDGKIILTAPGKLALNPNGNGDIYESLERPLYKVVKKVCDGADVYEFEESGVNTITFLQDRVDIVHIFGVDNILNKVADPIALGVLLRENLNILNKTVDKVDPEENVGVYALRDNCPTFLEYSEISSEQANSRDATTNRLLFGQANIVNHFLCTSFLQQVVQQR
uniref:UDP-N-acetylglucosamine diphosphorylase n=1 Tax=Lygus hesperus TaxID=30085 RepID=A0A0A9XJ91_LYGHE